MFKVFLDDIRMPPDNSWVIVRDVKQAQHLLRSEAVEVLSLDHDLGDDVPTGYDLVKWIEEEVFHGRLIPPVMKIHSANPVGRKNMEAGIQSINRMFVDNKNVGVL